MGCVYLRDTEEPAKEVGIAAEEDVTWRNTVMRCFLAQRVLIVVSEGVFPPLEPLLIDFSIEFSVPGNSAVNTVESCCRKSSFPVK